MASRRLRSRVSLIDAGPRHLQTSRLLCHSILVARSEADAALGVADLRKRPKAKGAADFNSRDGQCLMASHP